MKLKGLTISFPPSPSPDVVGYKLYMIESDQELTYESDSWALGNNTEIDLSTLDGMTTKDGTYNIGVTAVDDAGNESSMSVLEGVAVDFVSPDPPGALTIAAS